ncbi:MAG TPA: type 1 glutamine amidotransferase domain-containing protein, partial [Bdellovibrio sp.]
LPFLLENRLKEHGAKYTSSPRFVEHVVKSGRLVTGQNPASASAVAKAMVEVWEALEAGRSVPEQNWCEWPSHDYMSGGLA